MPPNHCSLRTSSEIWPVMNRPCGDAKSTGYPEALIFALSTMSQFVTPWDTKIPEDRVVSEEGCSSNNSSIAYDLVAWWFFIVYSDSIIRTISSAASLITFQLSSQKSSSYGMLILWGYCFWSSSWWNYMTCFLGVLLCGWLLLGACCL